ncbi:flagellar basal body rod protein FlgC [Lutimaribacter sp. EGI FJ00015]|uniref:Flagellar basal body rod protein FlgC n=1 Tax=Lutimaribacter degradans TaxID=2945989 RepID=A0ACC5ZUP1_9RHOB|nr:flagellar basal body rod protein FlgC [Lutimaribacter sp. EGI FJ00013]MCM2561895.1 flagellar basal body rod protein FlgC [Lutimaribacter sp. EGI FJ00013]MCO0613073.1 flagellar basal body rod protein FlgC [Lutimaribacter sp. EGI FJ00015]MCO0635727.1 flagellar basal body rod protein FlgC [Lutimaribacter sp. EGI FJ00014]
MSDFSRSLEVSTSGLNAQAQRLRHVSENIANADTPGYRRKTIPFEATMRGAGVSMVNPGRVTLDRGDLEQVYDPAHPMADETGHYLGSNVDLVIEVADAREAQRSYEANLKMFDQTRQMSSALMDLLRR